MAKAAEFGVFPVFIKIDGTLSVQPEMSFPSEDDARRAAEVFAGVLGGAVAFSRMADRETGLIEDGVNIGRYGVMAERAANSDADASSRERPQAA
jgi:hypothetical protein